MRTLIVERHEWETGATQRQLQFVLETAREFFGSGRQDRYINVDFFILPNSAPVRRRITISREYTNKTRRTNSFPEMSNIPASFIFFAETATAGLYTVWWQSDKAIVAARYHGWIQGQNTQHGRGRLSIIANTDGPTIIDRCD